MNLSLAIPSSHIEVWVGSAGVVRGILGEVRLNRGALGSTSPRDWVSLHRGKSEKMPSEFTIDRGHTQNDGCSALQLDGTSPRHLVSTSPVDLDDPGFTCPAFRELRSCVIIDDDWMSRGRD